MLGITRRGQSSGRKVLAQQGHEGLTDQQVAEALLVGSGPGAPALMGGLQGPSMTSGVCPGATRWTLRGGEAGVDRHIIQLPTHTASLLPQLVVVRLGALITSATGPGAASTCDAAAGWRQAIGKGHKSSRAERNPQWVTPFHLTAAEPRAMNLLRQAAILARILAEQDEAVTVGCIAARKGSFGPPRHLPWTRCPPQLLNAISVEDGAVAPRSVISAT